MLIFILRGTPQMVIIVCPVVPLGERQLTFEHKKTPNKASVMLYCVLLSVRPPLPLALPLCKGFSLMYGVATALVRGWAYALSCF